MSSTDHTQADHSPAAETFAETAAASSSQKSVPRTASLPPPSGRQLAEARKQRWHQDGNPLLTQEALREWIARSGLVAYGQRALQLGAPAPSLLEAVGGAPLDADAPPASSSEARTMLARLIAEGSVVPLNLLGVSGALGTDVPDFVASAAVFSYIFTLRGAKVWKQPPATAGSVKVSPLALAVYETLEAKNTLSAAELATSLGKEVTEGAVLRALNELWGQLRVLPLPQPDGAATLWELASTRFTKQIKSGANAGQPSALSAIITLYLGQALAATEDEIETFLSPLAPRSKVRDVLHALLPARQLETLVIEGKTLLHVAGELPAFDSGREAPAIQNEAPVQPEESVPRIRKFAAKPGGKIGTGLRAKPSFKSGPGRSGPGRSGLGRSGPGRSGSDFIGKDRSGGRTDSPPRPPFADRERRPFRREGEDRPRAAKPAFDKPWREDRKARPEPPTDFAASTSGESAARPRRTFSKPGTFGRKREGSAGGFERSPRRNFDQERDRPRRADRADGASGGFKRENARPAGDKPAAKRFSGKPFAKPGGKPFGGKPGGFKRDRPDAGASAEAPRKVYRKFDAPREGKPFRKNFEGGSAADRPAGGFGEDRPKRSFGDRAARSSGAASRPAPSQGGPGGKPFRPKPGFGSKAGSKPGDKTGFSAKKPFSRGGPGKPRQGGFKPVKRPRPEGDR